MKFNKRILTAIAVSAIVLPLAAPTATALAADYGTPNTVVTKGGSTYFPSGVNNSYSSFNNGQTVTTTLPYNANYTPNAAKIQTYLEGYINDFRKVNGLNPIQWDANAKVAAFSDTRLQQLKDNNGPDGHAGYTALGNQGLNPGVSEGLTFKASGTHSDQETAYFLFYQWYGEIDPSSKVQGHMLNMVKKSTTASVRVGVSSDNKAYAVLNPTPGQGGTIDYSSVQKMPAHTFIYE